MGKYGDIRSDVVLAPGQILRRNAADDGFEAFTPSAITGGEAWPVGSVFVSVVSTNPATLLGYGTWVAFGAGRVLVGLDSGDTAFDTVEETGGAKTSTPSAHSGTAVGDHAAHTHGVTSNVAVGNHTLSGSTGQASAGATQRGTTTSTLTLAAHTHTAGTLAVSAHSVTNNAVTSADPSATLTHSVTQPADHSALSVVQPYIVVYMFKRTA